MTTYTLSTEGITLFFIGDLYPIVIYNFYPWKTLSADGNIASNVNIVVPLVTTPFMNNVSDYLLYSSFTASTFGSGPIDVIELSYDVAGH